MKSTIARENPEKDFSLGDYGTQLKSGSDEKKDLLKKLFFLNALIYMLHSVPIFQTFYPFQLI